MRLMDMPIRALLDLLDAFAPHIDAARPQSYRWKSSTTRARSKRTDMISYRPLLTFGNLANPLLDRSQQPLGGSRDTLSITI